MSEAEFCRPCLACQLPPPPVVRTRPRALDPTPGFCSQTKTGFHFFCVCVCVCGVCVGCVCGVVCVCVCVCGVCVGCVCGVCVCVCVVWCVWCGVGCVWCGVRALCAGGRFSPPPPPPLLIFVIGCVSSIFPHTNNYRNHPFYPWTTPPPPPAPNRVCFNHIPTLTLSQ